MFIDLLISYDYYWRSNRHSVWASSGVFLYSDDKGLSIQGSIKELRLTYQVRELPGTMNVEEILKTMLQTNEKKGKNLKETSSAECRVSGK